MKFPTFLTASIVCLLMIFADSFERKEPQGISCNVHSCGGKDDVMQNVKFTLSPNPPQMQHNLTLTLDADITKLITNGSKVDGGFSINGKPKIFHSNFCDVITVVNLTCPLQPGPLHVPVVFPIYHVNPGDYKAFANATDQNGVPMFCAIAHCIVTA